MREWEDARSKMGLANDDDAMSNMLLYNTQDVDTS